jgi:hypothetical protein
VLSPNDDYPLHQTHEPIAHPVTSDLNFYDRYWFGGFSRGGEFMFEIANGLYPNRQVMDAALSIVRADGLQHSLLGSRRAPVDRTETRVGPLQVQVVEPMRTIRVTAAPNETGIEADLTFRARNAAVEEPPMTQHRDGRLIMQTSRFTQFGTWEGRIVAGGVHTEVSASSVYGVRDRSWGVRPIGEPQTGGPPASPPEVFWIWSPIHFDDCCVHFGLFEDRDGNRWYTNAAIAPAHDTSADFPLLEEPDLRRMVRVSHEIEWVKGTRRAARLELGLIPPQGETIRIELEPMLRFQMQGLGYGHPEWGHGFWKGEEEFTSESWNVFDSHPLEPRGLHVQQSCRARMGDREGVGLCEQIVIGPHAPSGFEELLDGAS